MKILHICLAAFYIDNFAYQENLLPRFQKKSGHEVEIIASTETFVDNMHLGYVEPSEYLNEDGIKVIRIPYVSWLPHKIAKKLRIYKGLSQYIKDFCPQFIFLHDVQFLSITEIIAYKQKHSSIRICADGHTDYINSARGFLSKKILHGIIYKHYVRKAIPYIERFYGTLPSRNDFFREMYGVPENKISLLPIGADDDMIQQLEEENVREKIRHEYNLIDQEYLFITGGKIDRAKEAVLTLMRVIRRSELPVKLLVFGSVAPELKSEFDTLLCSEKIIYSGWVNERKSYELLLSADAAIYPCLHSTLWEQSAGSGLPCALRHIEGFTHMNVNNNCYYMKNINEEEIERAIQYMYENRDTMGENALKCRTYFSYRRIAMSVLE